MNTLTICRKELNSYFRSPIAYGVMFFFAVITGYFFYAYVVSFVTFSIQSSMQGQSQPMSVNDQMIRPLLSNLAVIGLFFIPIITMRLLRRGESVVLGPGNCSDSPSPRATARSESRPSSFTINCRTVMAR